MYIPKMRVVSVSNLEEESGLSDIATLLRREYFLDFPIHLVDDIIPDWRDDDYEDIHPRLIKAYDYLCDNYGFLPGDSFIWSL